MLKVMCSPGKYVQGNGILRELDQHIQGMGAHLLVLLSRGGMKRIAPLLDACFAKKPYVLDYQVFEGESTRHKMEDYAARCRENGVTAVVGIGGGKVIDTAKGAAYYAGLPVVIVPTVCSTDAPCSSLSILYDEDGVFEAYLHLKSSPDIVLVDTEVIASAPARLLVAGMGDAMATYFEARACRKAGKNTPLGAAATVTATEIAAMCWKYLKRDGLKAKQAAERKICTPELENIVEINTYQSCIGFESGGLAAAHGIQKGFTVIPALHEAYHGDKVAFCTLVQLLLEEAPVEELNEVMDFCVSVGLPVCFAELGYTQVNENEIRRAAKKACLLGSTVHNLPFEVTADMVAEALLKADAMGTAYHRTWNERCAEP